MACYTEHGNSIYDPSIGLQWPSGYMGCWIPLAAQSAFVKQYCDGDGKCVLCPILAGEMIMPTYELG